MRTNIRTAYTARALIFCPSTNSPAVPVTIRNTTVRAMAGQMMESGGASRTDERLGNLYTMLSTDPEEDLSAMQKARSGDLGSRLHSLDSQFTQVQASTCHLPNRLARALHRTQQCDTASYAHSLCCTASSHCPAKCAQYADWLVRWLVWCSWCCGGVLFQFRGNSTGRDSVSPATPQPTQPRCLLVCPSHQSHLIK